MNLTFRQKILMAIALTAASTIVLCATALIALESILSNNQQVNRFGKVSGALVQLENQLYGLTQSRSQLTPATLEDFDARLTNVNDIHITTLNELLIDADAQVKPRTAAVVSATSEHLDSVVSWLNLRQQVGLSPAVGLLGELNQNAQLLAEGVSGMSTFENHLKGIRQHEKDFLLLADIQQFELAQTKLQALIDALTVMEFEEFIVLANSYGTSLTALADNYTALRITEAELEVQFKAVIDQTDTTATYIDDNLIREASTAAEESALNSERMLVVVGIIVLIWIISLLTFTGLGATRSLTRCVKALNQIASGDLTVRVEHDKDDEFGQLANAVNQVASDLSDVVSNVTTTSTELSGMSELVSSSIENIAQGNQVTSEQAISMAAATEQMNATVAEVSRMTVEVNDAAKSAQQAANEGGQIISRALQSSNEAASVVNLNVKQMQELERRSEKIDVVIEVIKSVAEQTNLLALNAAIEAARAGEAGRGFAVVADEVRALAEKTVVATNEITVIVDELQQGTREAVKTIEGGLESVESGSQHGAEAAEAVHSIKNQVETASDRTLQISVAIEQLASTVDDMAQNMNHISAAVSSSSNESESIVETSHQVSQHAVGLKELTTKFQVS